MTMEKPITKKYILYVLSRELFQGLLVVYILLSIIETIFTGAISNFFNLNYLLFALIATGVAMVLSEQEGFRYKLTLKK
jgi:hypothetical protein